MADKSKRHEANAQFAKLQRAEDAKQAALDYESAAVAIRAKTERLKALRLARDAAAAKVPVVAKAKGKRKTAAASLSEWRGDREKEGRER